MHTLCGEFCKLSVLFLGLQAASALAQSDTREAAGTNSIEAAIVRSVVPGREVNLPQTGTVPPHTAVLPGDENQLDAELAAARRILLANPQDVAARERLAGAAAVLIDRVLAAEAVGSYDSAQRLTQKLTKDLHDSGPLVQVKAQRGDLLAAQASGFLLGRGILLPKDAERSCAEFLAAADKLPAAGWHSARCLMDAAPERARLQMQKAAQLGHAAAQEWMGRRCLGEFGGTEKDFVCARMYLQQSAGQGRATAQALLAYLLVSGQGGTIDLPRAVALYTSAAEQGDVHAQNNLGEMYETGRGVARRLDLAIGWYERAANSGMATAQFNAGRVWVMGVDGRTDTVRARAFLARAENNGVPQARQLLEWLDKQGAAASAAMPK